MNKIKTILGIIIILIILAFLGYFIFTAKGVGM